MTIISHWEKVGELFTVLQSTVFILHIHVSYTCIMHLVPGLTEQKVICMIMPGFHPEGNFGGGGEAPGSGCGFIYFSIQLSQILGGGGGGGTLPPPPPLDETLHTLVFEVCVSVQVVVNDTESGILAKSGLVDNNLSFHQFK